MATSIFGNGSRPDSPRVSTPNSASSTRDSPPDSDKIKDIAAHGDLILQVEHAGLHKFRVDAASLKSSSKYFETLLRPNRFGEGVKVGEALKNLRIQYKSPTDMPASELPTLEVADLGRISVKSAATLFSDFLSILHGKELQTAPPVANLANLAIVADRFDALGPVGTYVKRKKLIRAIDGKTTLKQDLALSEEKVRQRLLVALLLDYPSWVEKYSLRLLAKASFDHDLDADSATWWDLPFRFEEELLYRRQSVLETIQSLQDHFLGLYTSRERQCKLGYDSSAQCDSFQLGEMIRFFRRADTLELRGTMVNQTEETEDYAGDVYALLDSLRQVPEYQIDRNHNHCGLRTRIIPLLDLLQECLRFVAVCSECWAADRTKCSWLAQKRPVLWKRQDFHLASTSHRDAHANVRGLFTATDRDWT